MSRGRRAATAALAATGLAATPSLAQAANGRVVFPTASGALIVVPPSGKATILRDRGAGLIGSSPSGKLLAYASGRGGDVTIADAKGHTVRKLRFRGLIVHTVDVSPDGKRLAITAYREAERGPVNIFPYLARTNGRGLTRLRTSLLHTFDMRFTHSGKSLVYAGAPSFGPFAACASLRKVTLDGADDRLLYEATGGDTPCVVNFSLSPGGRSAVFTGDPSPGQATNGVRSNVYRFDLGAKARPRLMQAQAFAATWSPAGDQLAFSTLQGTYRMSQFGGLTTQLSPTPALSLTWLKATS